MDRLPRFGTLKQVSKYAFVIVSFSKLKSCINPEGSIVTEIKFIIEYTR